MRKILKHFVLILLIAHCALIFGFSAQNKQQSSAGSARITSKIVEKVKSKEMSNRERINFRYDTERVVRKTAHVILYTILGVLAYLNARRYFKKRYLCIALLFCLLYAITDELHQLFVPGRSGQFTDVLVDFAGSLFGISVLYLIYKMKRRKKA